MSALDMIAESQRYLLGSGDAVLLPVELGDSLRDLGRALPIFADVLVQLNTWSAGTYDVATGTYTDATAAAQGAGSFAVTSLNVGDGHLVGASGVFGEALYTVSTVDSADGVYAWEYWNGLAWQPLPSQTAPDFSVLGLQTLRFDPPADWVRETPTDVLFPFSLDSTQFWLRLTTTTAPSLFAPVASLLTVRRAWFPLPASVLGLLSVHYFPQELEPVLVAQALDLLDPTWRSIVGTPTRYTQDLETTRLLRLIPMPDAVGATGIPPFTNIPGAVSANNHVVTLVVQTPAEDGLADWLEGMVALDLAAREAARQGELQDPPLAQSLQSVYGLVLQGLQALFQHEGADMLETGWQALVRRGG